MDILVREARQFNINGKLDETMVFFLDVRYEHWCWDVIRSLTEIQVLHNQVRNC